MLFSLGEIDDGMGRGVGGLKENTFSFPSPSPLSFWPDGTQRSSQSTETTALQSSTNGNKSQQQGQNPIEDFKART